MTGVAHGVQGSGRPSPDRYPSGPDGVGDQARRAGGLAKHTRTVFPRHQGDQRLDAPGLPFFELLHQIYAKDPATPETVDAIGRSLDGVTENDPTPKWARFNPYKGLPAFTSSDTAFFFGREQITRDILNQLIKNPDGVLALIGKSGVGKSSIALAGIMAALRSQIWPGAKDDNARWPDLLDDSRDWALMVLRPEDQPLRELARQFCVSTGCCAP
jgi:hypothetical protein